MDSGSLISTVRDSSLAMAAPLLLRGLPLIRFRLDKQHSVAVGIFWSFRRQWLTAAAGSKWLDENVSSEDTSKPVLSAKDPPRFLRWDESEFRKWKNLEDEILRDIEPITALTKQILHSNRYADGECLTTEDEKAVAEKLLAYHPHSEDKIGCGLDCIMSAMISGDLNHKLFYFLKVDRRPQFKEVDRHPQFRNSRCLFVIRTDGGWIDFSYQKCLRAYIRGKYPSHAERFIREHFKRSS